MFISLSDYGGDRPEESEHKIDNNSGEESDGSNHQDNNTNVVRGNAALVRGRGRGQAVRGRSNNRGARRIRPDRAAVEAALQEQWVSVDRQPDVPLPNNSTTGDFIGLFLTDEFFDILVEQTNLYAAQFKRNNPNGPPHGRASE